MNERPPGKATTEVTLRTIPEGAEVSVNGTYLARAPLVVPLRYPALVQVYERRRFLPWPHVESRELPRYERTFRFEALLPGFEPGTVDVFPQGEQALNVEIVLVPRATPP